VILFNVPAAKLQIITDINGAVDVSCHWMDYDLDAKTTTPGGLNTNITVGGPNTVVPGPGLGISRNLKEMHICNKSGAPIVVTIQHNDGATTAEMLPVSLPDSGVLQYVDGLGFQML
jgi:hypothetical protein